MSLFKKLKDKVVRVDIEGESTGKSNLGILEKFSKANKMPVFKETVKHGYESDFLGYKDKCPRCQSPTEQMMSNFAYATQEKSRLMAAPAGHFCTECSTVIIDDDIMRSGVDASKFWYGGVFSIETGYSNEPHLFETFNGEKPLLILDEDMQNVGGIAQSVHQKNAPFKFSGVRSMAKHIQQQKKKTNNRKKNKAAKNARKKNRRK